MALGYRVKYTAEPWGLRGEIAGQIDVFCCRVMVDSFVPPVEGNVALKGDGSLSTFQFHNAQVDMGTKDVETERLKLEFRVNKALFGLYRKPSTIIHAPGT